MSIVRLGRNTLRTLRVRSATAARFASRWQRATRYGADVALWSRLWGRRDPVPTDLPPALLASKGVAHPPPTLHLAGASPSTAAWNDGFAAVYATLLLNLQPPDFLSPIRYAHPAPDFRGVYLWDSAFISQIWRSWDPAVAHDVLEAVLLLRDGPRLQHVVADIVASRYTQPPLIAWALSRCVGTAGRPGPRTLSRAYRILKKYHEWLWRHRQPEPGLFAWAHPYESGIDNSPRFSNRDESALRDTRRLASPDFAAYVLLQLEALERIARQLGAPADSDLFRERAALIRRATNELLWHHEEGLYFDLDLGSRRHVRSRTIASLLPLWAGIPDRGRAERLCGWIDDPAAFNTKTPLPSVALNDPDFSKDMWRGPVWINTAYGVIQGLLRYGRLGQAAELAYRLCDGVYRTHASTRRLHEFYDPERHDLDQLHRKRGNRWKQFTLGGKPVSEFVGWTGLVNTLVIDTLFGFTSDSGSRRLRPLLPARAAGRSFSLRLPAERLAMTIEREGDSIRGVARTERGLHRFRLAVGESLDIDRGVARPTAATANV